MSEVDVLVTQLDPDLPLPTYAHAGDAGLDLYSAIDVEVAPYGRVLVPTGIAIALPAGFAAFVHPRSGLAIKHGLTVANAPGTIDAGYRGQVQVGLVNLDPKLPVAVSRGDRIAQLIVQRVETVLLHLVDQLPGSARGAGGFGSTGGMVTSEDSQ